MAASRRISRRPVLAALPRLLVCVACLVVGLAARPGTAADLSSLYAAKSPSVVTITNNGKPAGTGFFVGDHLLATCLHVTREAVNLGYAENYRDGIRPISRQVAVDPAHDLAIYYTEKAGPTLEIILPNTLVPGVELASIGSPLGFEKSIAQGNFNNLRDDGKTEYLQVSTPASHGSSGSPLFNAKGQVVGVMQQAVKPQFGQNLNFAISSKHLIALLTQASAMSPAEYRAVGATPKTPAEGSGKNFGAYYAWIDSRGVYCFTATPPPSQSLGRMLTRQEVLDAPVSYMWSSTRPNVEAMPAQGAAAP